MRNEFDYDWRTIGALNLVSAMAQVGQFAIAFVVLPVWLAQQGLDASQLGIGCCHLCLVHPPQRFLTGFW
jgi:hypothetical protein